MFFSGLLDANSGLGRCRCYNPVVWRLDVGIWTRYGGISELDLLILQYCIGF